MVIIVQFQTCAAVKQLASIASTKDEDINQCAGHQLGGFISNRPCIEEDTFVQRTITALSCLIVTF